MAYHLSDVADIQSTKNVMLNLWEATGVPIEIIDLEGNAILGSGLQDICACFHQKSSQTKPHCFRKNLSLLKQVTKNGKLSEESCIQHKCKNGLTDYVIPIMVEEKLLGFAFVGQFLSEVPDEVAFSQQALQNDFENITYLKSLHKVPVYSQDKQNSIVKLQSSLLESFITMGLRDLKRREVKADLRKNKALLQSFLNHTDNAIMTLDSDYKVTYYNQQYLQLYPFDKSFLDSRPTMEDIIRRACEMGFYPQHEVEDLIARRYMHLEQPGLENVIETPRLDGVLVEGFSNKLPEDGYLLSFRDISEQKKKIDDHRRSSHLAALGTIAAGVAHEINNPMQGVINYATLIKNSPGNEKRNYEIAQRIILESDRIVNLTKDLLFCARDNHTERVLTDVKVLIIRAISLIETKAKRKGVAINAKIPDDLPNALICPQEIQQTIINLVDNAYDAVRSDCIPLERRIIDVNAQIVGDDMPHLCLEIADRGVGMSARTLQKAKDVFFTTKSAAEGTGLGLAIVNDIVKKHNGIFDIESEEGSHTKARILIPVH